MNSKTLYIVIGAWLVAVAAGSAVLMEYSTTPGQATQAAADWPPQSALQPAAEGATLVVFAHPRCPCSRASIGELERILARRQAKTYVAFYRPEAEPDAWAHSDLWRQAAAIPGVQTVVDPDGREARRFGSITSGAAVLYLQGKLKFAGGITPSRGHYGDSAGKGAIMDLLAGATADVPSSPVYGCQIYREQSL